LVLLTHNTLEHGCTIGDNTVVQDYIRVLEHISEARRREVLTLKADKRRAEVHAAKVQQAAAHGPAHGDLFCARETSTLPCKLRAIVEDNRVLKEKARKFRQRASEAGKELDAARTDKAELARQLQECRLDLQHCSQPADDIRALEVRVHIVMQKL
jgi:hypothetical protein